MAELGVGYVSIVPSMKGFSGQVSRELNGMDPALNKAGDKGGQSFGKKFTSDIVLDPTTGAVVELKTQPLD